MKTNKLFPQFFQRNAIRERMARCYKTDAEIAAELKLKEQNDFLAVVKKSVSDEFAIKIKSYEDTIEGLKAELKKAPLEADIKAFKDNLATLEATVKSLKESKGELSEAGKSIKSQIEKQMEAKKEEFAAFKANKQKSFTLDLDLKAAITMLESASLGGSNFLPKPEIRPGYIDLVRNQPLIENYASGGATKSATIVYVNKYNAQGTAAMTAEGATLNLVSAELKTENSTAYLVGAYEKVSIQMLDDVDFMAAFMEQELRYQVDIAVDNLLLTGSGSSTLKGVTVYAVAYTNANISTTNANDFDCIRAVIGQMKAVNFTPTNVFINPTDGANMDLVKDLYGRPIAMEYKDASGNLFRVAVVESNQIAVGKVLVADMTKFLVWNLLGFQIQYGWENDDFRKNLVSVSGIRRLHSYVSLNHLNGFVYDSFVNIKTAIAPSP